MGFEIRRIVRISKEFDRHLMWVNSFEICIIQHVSELDLWSNHGQHVYIKIIIATCQTMVGSSNSSVGSPTLDDGCNSRYSIKTKNS